MSAVLCIDTASSDFAIALARDGDVVASLSRAAQQDHSRLLLPAIDGLLGGDRRQLTGIVVVRGPGSYAGLRVGIATGEGLALALGVPIHGVATMDAVAAAASLRDGVAIHPAGRGEFACQRYSGGQPEGPLATARADDLTGAGLAGEGAGALGGREVSAEARCRAALALGLPLFATGAASSIEAVYLREPNITLPRRQPAR